MLIVLGHHTLGPILIVEGPHTLVPILIVQGAHILNPILIVWGLILWDNYVTNLFQWALGLWSAMGKSDPVRNHLWLESLRLVQKFKTIG